MKWILLILVLSLIILVGHRLYNGQTGFISNAVRKVVYTDSWARKPGPTRNETLDFKLNTRNSLQVQLYDSPDYERWKDAAGTPYSMQFRKQFSYKKDAEIRVAYQLNGPTFQARIEAKNLKPNFAYQIKLLGDYRRDIPSFERLGYNGRWRLPIGGTNFIDEDYENTALAERQNIEAYILFDYFVTDKNGNAVRELYLDCSLHVLWRDDQLVNSVSEAMMDTFTIETSEAYEKQFETKKIKLYAEKEHQRYQNQPERKDFLPEGNYAVDLMITEESFHDSNQFGGFWATVGFMPMRFSINK